MPSGLCVEVTLPEGVTPDTVIEFTVPNEQSTPDGSSAEHSTVGAPENDRMEGTMESPVLAHIYWEAKPQAARASDALGLSNATVERIYVARLPPGFPPNASVLYAELTAGGALLAVPLPVGTRPAGSVHFQAPVEADEQGVIEVLKKGHLSKKSPKSLAGIHTWQTRWFELQQSHLSYWELSKIEGAVKKGVLPLSDIIGVRAHQVRHHLPCCPPGGHRTIDPRASPATAAAR